MIPLTPPRPPIIIEDPMAQFILAHAPAEVQAPPRPRIVDQRCRGNLGEKAVFDALNYLTILYAPTGRKDFTITEIHRYAEGVSRSRIPDYIRGLCDKGLVDVIGHRENKRLRPEFWSARYAIDRDRLNQESALVVAEDVRYHAVPIPTRQPMPTPGQIALDLDLPPPSTVSGIHGQGANGHGTPGRTVSSPQVLVVDGHGTPGRTVSNPQTVTVPLGERSPSSSENGQTVTVPLEERSPSSSENGQTVTVSLEARPPSSSEVMG
jgi:hypothetical protein